MIYLTDRWDEFDGWCLMQGVETRELTSRRLVTLAGLHVLTVVDPARLPTLEDELNVIGEMLLHPEKAKVETPSGKRRMPPPGWKSDDQNWAAVQGFLGQVSGVKGAISRG